MTAFKPKRPNADLSASRTFQLEFDGEDYGTVDVRYFNTVLPYHRRVSGEFVLSLSEDERKMFSGEILDEATDLSDDEKAKLAKKRAEALQDIFIRLFCTHYITDSKLLDEKGNVAPHSVENLVSFFSGEFGTLLFEQVIEHAGTLGNYRLQAQVKSKKK